MDIKELLEELSKKVRDTSFTELTKNFRSTIKQSRGYTNDEKREFYAQYKQLWDERKAWLENRKHEQEQKAGELDYQLDAVERLVESNDFVEQSRLFEKEFHRLGKFADEQKHKLWERYLAIRAHRQEFLSLRHEVSGSTSSTYEQEILAIDTEFGGAPELKEGSQWDKIGSHIQESREKLREVRKKIESDNDLLRPEKRLLFELIDSIRAKIKESESLTFINHGKRAAELFEEAKQHIESSNVGRASGALKDAQSHIRMLWLKKGEKDRYLNGIEELWAQLKDKRKHRKEQFHDWLEKQKEGLVKLVAVRDKAVATLERVQKNLEDNRQRMVDARSVEFGEKIAGWVKEGEEKEADIQKSVNDLNKKIFEIEDKLKKHGLFEADNKADDATVKTQTDIATQSDESAAQTVAVESELSKAIPETTAVEHETTSPQETVDAPVEETEPVTSAQTVNPATE